MTRYYRRRRPDRRETATAAALAAGVAAGVGAAVFYLTRIFLSRETMGERSETDATADDRGGAARDP